MNFLDICKKVNQLGEFQGAISSVVATGYQAEIVEVVRQAYVDIQLHRDTWFFLQRDKTFNIGSSAITYTPTTIFTTDTLSSWDKGRILYNYKPLRYIPYDAYILIDTSAEVAGKPDYFTIRPYDSALIFNKSDATYAISAHYHMKPQSLVGNAEELLMPSEHHYVVVYLAMTYLPSLLSSEIYQRAVNSYNVALGQLLRKQCPEIYITRRPIA